jgi:L-alanine-DL-glutamate epimerase-like enolase superfamily enzyme
LISEKTAVLAIQSGEYGPIAQVIAGIDLAAWDLFSKKSSQALWKYLGGSNPTIKTYASGINPDHPEKIVNELLLDGYTAFKLKIGFNEALDIENLNNIRKLIPSNLLMVDANQAWDLPTAIDRIKALVKFDLNWIEEPIRADSPLSHWQKLSSTHQIRLAAGENMVGEKSFDEAIASGAFRVIQPDIAKWGGISGCLPIIKKLHEHKIEYCPHYLGGGIGLMASAHLLAASSSTGMLEIDSNPNPLRSLLSTPLDSISDGKAVLSDKPGIGIDPDLDALSQFLIH